MEPVPVLMVTYNRLKYSRLALASILKSPGVPVKVTIWDNGSTEPGMQEWLDASALYYNGVVDVIYSPKNVGLAVPMNCFFKAHATYPFVAKVDNDTVMPDNWLRDLMDVMTEYQTHRLGAVSGTCLRPYGMTGKQWLASMSWDHFHGERLHFNSYPLGTGVLINMEMIRTRGLLFEKFPRSADSGPDDPCLISGWTAYAREASEFEGCKFALYSKVPVQLLNIRSNSVVNGQPCHELSNDYPEYDAEIQKVRDEGNAWWDLVGGMSGVREYVRVMGGLEKLVVLGRELISATQYRCSYVDPQYANPDPETLTEAKNIQERSTPEFWRARIAEHGTTASTFLSTPQARINEFTERHEQILGQIFCDLDCSFNFPDILDVACGWGRFSRTVDRFARSYVGVDFMPELIEKARESLPDLHFEVMDARALAFPDASFDVVLSVTGLSSFAGIFEEVLREFHRVLRPGGRIIFLEEHFARIDWKLENE